MAEAVQTRNNKARTGTLNTAMILSVILAFIAMAVSMIKLPQVSSNENSPIESAALAAAESLSKIVIDTADCGFVSLSDYPDGGTATLAKDGYCLPVKGINTLIGTARLNLIVADNLEQTLMEEFAEQDLKQSLSAKDELVTALKRSLKGESKYKDLNGKPVNPSKAALLAYKAKSKKQISIHLSLGCLEGGAQTNVPVPTANKLACVPTEMQEEGFYRAFTNIPFKKVDFVFGGIGKTLAIVDSSKWIENIIDLPYQFPTIVRAKASSAGNKSDHAEEIACAQPAGNDILIPSVGALTLSFPDGPVPEIKHPRDCYLNESLNSADNDTIDLLSAQNGDYPIDSLSHMIALNWPLSSAKSCEPMANIWRLALHDWIRRAGPRANIGSVVQMQSIALDLPKPSKVMWSGPLESGRTYSPIEPISAGIIHVFEFDQDGFVIYKSKILAPHPLNTSSQNQLYAECFGALKYSDIGVHSVMLPLVPRPKRCTMRAVWDVYIRDEVRHPGIQKGGKHGGQPIAMPTLATTGHRSNLANNAFDCYEPPKVVPVNYSPEGASDDESETIDHGKGFGNGLGIGVVGLVGKKEMGYPPLIAPQSDFGEAMSPPPPFVRPMPFGTGRRPFARATGTAVDIRFRRQIDTTELNGYASTGYLGILGSDQ
ncbi:MAG: hypothetical protein K8F91_24475 [Candidatus Obscuribacterales bacterium]|nr:hypothetical protein [Candidatus Obscuribacterales bacterium]